MYGSVEVDPELDGIAAPTVWDMWERHACHAPLLFVFVVPVESLDGVERTFYSMQGVVNSRAFREQVR